MKRILIINTSPFIANGITNVITNYYQYMDKRDMQIEVVAINEPSENRRRPFDDGGSQLYVLKRRDNIFIYFINLMKVLKNGNYDVVHIHGNSALMVVELMAACLTGVKRRIVHGHNTTCSHMTAHKLLWPLFMLLATDRLACGRKVGEWLYRDYDFRVLKNGVDLEWFRFQKAARNEYREKLGLNGELLIGHIGHFSKQKNHKFIIELFVAVLEKMNGCRLLLIGDGPNRRPIEEEITDNALSSKVTIIPVTSEINGYMSAMDVFILPSLFEGLPVVSIEAQAADLPCVFSDAVSRECNLTGGIQFLPLQDKTGWVNAILYARKEARNSKAAISKLTDEGYNIEENVSALSDIYRGGVKPLCPDSLSRKQVA